MAAIASNVLTSQPVNITTTTTGTEIVGKKMINTTVIPLSIEKINSLTCAREQYVYIHSIFSFILSLSIALFT
jgi:hypothetical protein